MSLNRVSQALKRLRLRIDLALVGVALQMFDTFEPVNPRSVAARCVMAFVIACTSSGAFACRFKARPWDDLLREAPVVFVGTVEMSSNDLSGKGPNQPATFVVQSVLKGAVVPGQRVEVATSNSTCGLRFTKNQQWMVLAGGQPLSSDAMSGSLLLRSEMGVPQKDNQERAGASFAARSPDRVPVKSGQ